MLALDVNVVVETLRDAPEHDAVRAWLSSTLDSGERVGLSDAVLTGALRILTHPRIFDPPADLDESVAAIDGLLAHPQVDVLKPLPGYWRLVADLCQAAGATGNLVADAAHAAVAIQHGATFVSRDRDFGRFPQLVCRQPG